MIHSAGIITVSDRSYEGKREDLSGPGLKAFLEKNGFPVKYMEIVPDETEMIEEKLIYASDSIGLSLLITTGGTGFSPRDVTPEATKSVIEREVPGIPEIMRAKSMEITSKACLSRAAAGIRGETLIINLPGSPGAAIENLSAVIGVIAHGLDVLRAKGPMDCANGEKEKNGGK